MIDLVYKTLLTILNKDKDGYITPEEFNILANNVQQEIFSNYFEEINRDKIKEDKGMSTKGYGNLNSNESFKVSLFSTISNIEIEDNMFSLPDDLYFIEQDGIITNTGNIVEKVDNSAIGYLNNSICKPSLLTPVYRVYNHKIKIYPESIDNIEIAYVRKPKVPKWTYIETTQGTQFFNPANPSFQDFELHESEFTNIMTRLLSYSGINLRESEIIKIAESLKNNLETKEQQS